ncbi:MAG: hypothetical protein AB7G39_12690, partial [Alphaproteobacteria bacterium]
MLPYALDNLLNKDIKVVLLVRDGRRTVSSLSRWIEKVGDEKERKKWLVSPSFNAKFLNYYPPRVGHSLFRSVCVSWAENMHFDAWIRKNKPASQFYVARLEDLITDINPLCRFLFNRDHPEPEMILSNPVNQHLDPVS